MDFLQDIFTEPLSYDAFTNAVQAKGYKIADLSGGGYVAKEKFDKVNNELKTARENAEKLNTEFDALKADNATADEWKTKFEALQSEVAEKERLAKEAAEAAEKKRNIETRFNAANVDKDGKRREWYNTYTEQGYLGAFAKALEADENTGKSDIDILNSLVKDDATAFKGIRAEGNAPLKGAEPFSNAVTLEDFKKMGYAERLKLKSEHPDIYKVLSEQKKE